jgi:predicted nuclease with TOPRIM domain
MSVNISENQENVGCGPPPSASENETCGVCAPKMALTYEEEAVLTEMRQIKTQVKPVAERLKEIQGLLDDSSGNDDADRREEWERLSGRLEALRAQWKEWEQRLEEAVERKLIMLGHRPPK